MKTATIQFNTDKGKREVINGSNLTMIEEGAFVKIKDGDDVLFSANIAHVVYISFSK